MSKKSKETKLNFDDFIKGYREFLKKEHEKTLYYNQIARELIDCYTISTIPSKETIKVVDEISKKDAFGQIMNFLIDYKKVLEAQEENSSASQEWVAEMTEQLGEFIKNLLK